MGLLFYADREDHAVTGWKAMLTDERYHADLEK
jgi:hypothetical protein